MKMEGEFNRETGGRNEDVTGEQEKGSGRKGGMGTNIKKMEDRGGKSKQKHSDLHYTNMLPVYNIYNALVHP